MEVWKAVGDQHINEHTKNGNKEVQTINTLGDGLDPVLDIMFMSSGKTLLFQEQYL